MITADRRSFLACLQESAEAASVRPADEAEARFKSSGSSDSSLSHTASAAGGDSAAEMARFGAAKERKHSREAGIALFNRHVTSLAHLASVHDLSAELTLEQNLEGASINMTRQSAADCHPSRSLSAA